ncbi:MAG: hypothetical protein RIQ99_1634 [Pseudomonadota bacterium]|jgi:signal transduction histidine kinase
MQITSAEYFRHFAVSLLIITGLVALVSWVLVRKTADRAGRSWFMAIVLQLATGMVLFTVDSAWRDAAYLLATITMGSSLYLMLYALLLQLKRSGMGPWLGCLWLTHFTVFTVMLLFAPRPDLAFLQLIWSAMALDIAIIVYLGQLRERAGLAATALAQAGFAIALASGVLRTAFFFINGQLMRYAEFSVQSAVALALQAAAIVFCCFFYIALSIQQAEAREQEMRSEATRLKVQRRLAEEHAAATQVLIEQRDHMMILNSRFSTISAMSLLGGGVIHEIAQPLQAARSAIDVLALTKDPTAQTVARNAAAIQSLIDRISEIVENLRRLMGEKTIDLEDVDCGALLTRIFPIFASEARRRDVDATCSIEPAAALHRVRANQVLLERVMFNLTANAIEAFDGFTPASGTPKRLIVSAGVLETDDRPALVVRFTDTGAGIPDLRHDEIFEPLKSGKVDGSGFGLFMVKTLIESWNGSIRALPNSTDGQGTVIELLLPIAPQ